MVNGLSQGSYSRFYRSGQKAEEATLKDGLKVGKSSNWDENGNITYIEH